MLGPLKRRTFIRGLGLFVALGAGLYLAGMLWTGWNGAVATLVRIGPWNMLLAGLIASSAYLVRFARWRYMLRCLGHRPPDGKNLGIYVSGLALTTSPGKLGETIRSVLLLPYGVPPAHSLGAFLADRMSDVLGVCLLGALTGWAAGMPMMPLVSVFLLAGSASFGLRWAICHPGALERWQGLAKKLSRLPVHFGKDVLGAWADLWTLSRTVAYTLVAVLAYGTQALVFAALCSAAGIQVSVLAAVAMFTYATLFGAASMAPGGLGAMEGALVVQLMLGGTGAETAVSVAIATRMATLWLGVLIGFVTLVHLSRDARDEGEGIGPEAG